MKFLVQAVIAVSLVLCATASGKIRTRVYAAKTGNDVTPPEVELVTVIREYGAKQMERYFSKKNLPVKKRFPGLGVLIADANFTGYIPTGINVRVTEDDGEVKFDDGVCSLNVETKFTTDPITIKCIRQKDDGLRQDYIITVVIEELV